MDPSRIVKVMAFYRDDMPRGGIGLSMTFAGEDGNRFAAAAEKALLFFDTHATPEACYAQLAEWGRIRPDDQETKERIILTVHWLERRGHLKPDDHNGVMWAALQGTTLIVLREDDPTGTARTSIDAAGHEIRRLDPEDFERMLRGILHADAPD